MIDNKIEVDVVFNCSTNVVGGGIQNSVNFIKQIILNNGYGLEWFFLLSPQVYLQVKDLLVNDRFYIAYRSPASTLEERNKIYKLVNDLSPSVVYTSAGPAYIKFPVFHIMGCSNPYILGASNYAYHLYGGTFAQLKRKFKTVYQRLKIKDADAWIAQTKSSEKKLRDIVGKNSDITIIHNSVSKNFLNHLNSLSPNSICQSISVESKKILVPTAYYKHKDLEKIPEAIALLTKKYNVSVKVLLTIGSNDDFDKINNIAKRLNVENCIENIGAFTHNEALRIYSQCDIVLQPSALEVFSTSYIEAMATLKPLVVPKYDFSESICSDYAYYYDSGDIHSYVDAIFKSMHDIDIESRYNKAMNIVVKYGSQEQRVKNIVSLIKKCLFKVRG